MKSLDIISGINPTVRYLTWWDLADKYPAAIYFFETVTRLLCHASLLKAYDVRLKSLPRHASVCELCDLAAMDDVRQLVLLYLT